MSRRAKPIARLAALLGLAALTGGTALPAYAQLQIDITQGNIEPLPIAIPDFITEGDLGDLGSQMAEVVANDLESSGLFKPLDEESFIQRNLDIAYQPTFADWRVINADALVVGKITKESEERLLVEFRLWNIFGEEQLAGLRFATTPDNWRRISHKVADAIYKQLTGEEGYFDSRIVYISESGDKLNRRKRLAIMDQDGANKQTLLAGSDLVLTPRFDPTSQTITYLSFEPGRSKVYLYDISSGRRELLGDFPGMMFAPRFSPDGKQLAMSMDRAGNTDVYVMDLQSRSTQRLTSDPGIDVAATFAPDGKALVFQSDRGGSSQLYTMNADGSGTKRISRGKGRYNNPVWSPRGDKIAFVRASGGKFGIGVMNPDGTGERILAESYMDEAPTWSPNGRVLMFHRTQRGSGNSSLYAVDLTGRNLRKVDTNGGASDPAWSPLLD